MNNAISVKLDGILSKKYVIVHQSILQLQFAVRDFSAPTLILG